MRISDVPLTSSPCTIEGDTWKFCHVYWWLRLNGYRFALAPEATP